MPSSPFLFHSGFGVIASISVLTLLASLLTLIASTFLLWRYRRTVARLMSAQATGAERGVTTGLQSAPASKLASGESVPAKARPVSFSPENRLADRLYRLTISEPRRHACKYALAGVLFALLMGLCGFFAFSQTQINYLRAAAHPFQFLFVFWIFAWPIVLTTNIVGASSERNRWLILLSYFAVLVMVGGLIAAMPTEASVQAGNVILPAWSGETPIRLVSKWSLFNLPPTLLFITFRQRHVRAVAPLVLSFMTIVSIGVLSIIAAAFIFKEASVAAITFVSKTLGVSEITAVGGYFLLLFIVACLLFGLLGWRLVAWMRSGYEQKTLSDQTLGIDALWLIFASFYAAILAFAGPGWALAAPVAFLIFKIVVSVGNKKLHSKSDGPHQIPHSWYFEYFRSASAASCCSMRSRSIGATSGTFDLSPARTWRSRLSRHTSFSHLSAVNSTSYLFAARPQLTALFPNWTSGATPTVGSASTICSVTQTLGRARCRLWLGART